MKNIRKKDKRLDELEALYIVSNLFFINYHTFFVIVIIIIKKKNESYDLIRNFR